MSTYRMTKTVGLLCVSALTERGLLKCFKELNLTEEYTKLICNPPKARILLLTLAEKFWERIRSASTLIICLSQNQSLSIREWIFPAWLVVSWGVSTLWLTVPKTECFRQGWFLEGSEAKQTTHIYLHSM